MFKIWLREVATGTINGVDLGEESFGSINAQNQGSLSAQMWEFKNSEFIKPFHLYQKRLFFKEKHDPASVLQTQGLKLATEV